MRAKVKSFKQLFRMVTTITTTIRVVNRVTTFIRVINRVTTYTRVVQVISLNRVIFWYELLGLLDLLG